uniref:Uncharacterized protein n=1 Tax=Arundo donax TaxID=35708 RepID=A0A0A9D293_ARUDO
MSHVLRVKQQVSFNLENYTYLLAKIWSKGNPRAHNEHSKCQGNVINHSMMNNQLKCPYFMLTTHH